MSSFDDPNREVVGLEPIWTGAGDVGTPQADEPEPEHKAKHKSDKD